MLKSFPLTVDPGLIGVSGIYIGRCKVNNKVYVGSSKNLYKRISSHLRGLFAGKHGNSILQNSWNKYGPRKFEWKVVEVVEDLNFLIAREQFWIWRLKASTRGKGFNICHDADSPRGVKLNKKQKEALSVSFKNFYKTKEGLKRRKKISIFMKGRVFSPQQRLNMSRGIKKFHWSPEGRERIRVIAKKLSTLNTGKKASKSTKLKMSRIRKGRRFSEAHKIALSVAAKKRWRQ